MADHNMEALAGGEEMSITALFLTNALEHKDISNKLNELSESMKRIEAHTAATNGRVTILERWKWMVGGFFIVIIPVVIFLINTVMNNTGVIRKFEQMHSKELSTTPNSQPIQ